MEVFIASIGFILAIGLIIYFIIYLKKQSKSEVKFQDIKDVNDNIIELSNAFYEFTKAFGNGKPKEEIKAVPDNGHKDIPVKDNNSYAEAMSQILEPDPKLAKKEKFVANKKRGREAKKQKEGTK